MIVKDMVDFLQEKEGYIRLKLKLVKVAAMLNEDQNYTKEDAFYDILKVIQRLDLYEVSVQDNMLKGLRVLE